MMIVSLKQKLNKIRALLFNKPKFVKKKSISDLFIFDDLFPHPISGFRYEEFKELLMEFKGAKILSEPLSYHLVNTDRSLHKTHVNNFKLDHPSLKDQIIVRKNGININSKLFYCLFLNNIYNQLFWLDQFEIPFVFTLYPGGGFEMNSEISDQKLRKVLKSPQFRKVIVTQRLTNDYLIENNFCSPNQIEFIFGGVVPQESLNLNGETKPLFPSKTTFDIVFCAAKYMPKGLDKGYDVFIEMAKRLVLKYDFIHFHVIGGFGNEDIDVTLLYDKITFYGYKKFDELQEIYKKMDVIVSPNRPFLLGKGSFDGFPLGTVVEAVLNGVVALVTDKLSQNTEFQDQTDLIIIDTNPESIEKQIVFLIENPEKLKRISENGKNKFKEVYSNNFQMKPRINLLREEILKTP